MGPIQGERRSPVYRAPAALACAALALGVAAAPGTEAPTAEAARAPAGALATGRFVWSPRALIDRQQPFSSNHVLTAVSCPSVSLCVAADNEGEILTSRNPKAGNAASWTIVQVDRDDEITGISCPSRSLCVAVDYVGDVLTSRDPARAAAARWIVKPVRGARELESVSCTSRSLCVAVGSGFYQGTRDLILTSTDPRRGSGARWSLEHLRTHGGPTGETAQLTGVSCPSSRLCLAAGENFTVLTSTDPARGTTARWTEREPAGLLTGPIGVSCPSPSFCDVGGVLTSTNPAAGAHARWRLRSERERLGGGRVSCVSRRLCVAPQNAGSIAVTTHADSSGSLGWSVLHLDGERETAGVSCVATLCVALDRNGRILTSTDPADGARSTWSVADVDGFNYLSCVTCTAAPLCVAVDHDGTVLSTTNPLGGPTSWQPRNVDGTRFLDAVSCVETTLCVAVDAAGNVVSSTDPAAGAAATWTVENVDGPDELNDVSCPTASLCVAVGADGDVLTSTDPGDGPSAIWGSLNIAGTTEPDRSLLSLACPTASVCLAASYSGEIFVSTDPQAGTRADWRPAPGRRYVGQWRAISCPSTSLCEIVGPEIVTVTDPGQPDAAVANKLLPGLLNPFSEADELHAVSCPSSSQCLIVEARGNVLESTDPADGRRASWRVRYVDRLHALWALSCVSPSLCVGVDDHGYAFVGRRGRTPAGRPHVTPGGPGGGPL